MNPEQLKTASIAEIARFIRNDCTSQGKRIPFGAVPYLTAMGCMQTVNDSYGCDDGRGIVAYALGNLTGWKGENARNAKKELNSRIK